MAPTVHLCENEDEVQNGVGNGDTGPNGQASERRLDIWTVGHLDIWTVGHLDIWTSRLVQENISPTDDDGVGDGDGDGDPRIFLGTRMHEGGKAKHIRSRLVHT
ncbi:hypothetical protein ACLKA7_008345 [Drosophila subpalustris]